MKLRSTNCERAGAAGSLSNLCVPREIIVLKEIPKLGTGKVNHRELQQVVNTAATTKT